MRRTEYPRLREGQNQEAAPLVGKIRTVASMLDSSVATVRRRMRDDPMFPRPFRLSEEADLMWVLTDIEAYVAAKAAKARAA